MWTRLLANIEPVHKRLIDLGHDGLGRLRTRVAPDQGASFTDDPGGRLETAANAEIGLWFDCHARGNLGHFDFLLSQGAISMVH